MTTPGKIRLLLGLLCASLLFTAIIVQNTYTPLNSLRQTAQILESNLHLKEGIVKEQLNNKDNFKELKSLANDAGTSLKLIQKYTTDNSIWFITLKKGALTFWSGIKVIPENTGAIKNGYSFIETPNGYYEAIKKTEGDFSAIFFIPVKVNYAFQNQYLKNTFAADLITDKNIEIADFTDKAVYAIKSVDNTYLFSIKLKQGEVNHRFFYYELACWILALISLCVLVQDISSYIANRGHVFLSILFLASFIVLLRLINLHYNWPDFTYKVDVFNPRLYGSSFLFPSLGDLCVNIVFLCWFTAFLYKLRHRFIKKTPGQAVSYLIYIGGIMVLVVTSTVLLNIFNGLVVNSKINFDVSNLLNLSAFSMLGVLMLCFSFLAFYLLIEVFLTISRKLPIVDSYKIYLFATSIFIATAVSSFYFGFTLFYLLWAAMALIRAHAHKYNHGKIHPASFASIVVICALISSIKLNAFESIKEKASRMAFIQKLEVPDDATADIIFKRIEKQVIADPAIVQYFNDTLHNSDYLKNRFQKLYFDGHLSRYEFKVHIFDTLGEPISAEKNYSLAIFKEMVLYSSFKVSEFFYRENDSFGYQNYFAILPVIKKDQLLGTVVIELKSKRVQLYGSLPELLIDGQTVFEDEFKKYSYAFYIDDKLLSQSGDYVYNLNNTVFKGELKKYVFKKERSPGMPWYMGFKTYSHLIYKPGKRNLLVVSKEENMLLYGITSITFFFVVLLIFGSLLLMIRWLWLRMKILSISENKIKWSFKINFDRVLYKTRIQFSMVLAVVATLILVGFITFLSISSQYNAQQDKAIREKITQIMAVFENGSFYKDLSVINEASRVEFTNLANANATDLILYDSAGVPLITTQPKIYEYGLQARRMNARAYINLKGLQKSVFVNNETIGNLSYKAAYSALRNGRGETVAYLQVPYFSNAADYRDRIGSLINVMINVYALVFIAIGLFAVIIARQITAPLNFIQQSLSNTMYGRKNEPIKWDRDDEIGALVQEYNKMIAALENSAQRLAQSERESAWREMAKQVAHEIKNPLTPLKLGLQLLDKSWKDKDPKFDQKFERFSKSFVEQIESLSSIASEFSAFAKMPDTRMELINIFDMLTQAVTIFKQMDNVQIIYQAPEIPFYINADRDQLLRCFNNLLKNAIEATPAERMGIIEINFLITNKNILLTIKDNGNGIPEHMREKIFEPNFTTKSSGTGLGLAFVKNSIENAGGKVWFETILGTGTTFYFSLPAA